MPIDTEKINKVNALLDSWLDMRAKYPDDDDPEDEDTDPREFLEVAHHLPVAEPPAMPQEDSTPQRIHGSPTKDLFS